MNIKPRFLIYRFRKWRMKRMLKNELSILNKEDIKEREEFLDTILSESFKRFEKAIYEQYKKKDIRDGKIIKMCGKEITLKNNILKRNKSPVIRIDKDCDVKLFQIDMTHPKIFSMFNTESYLKSSDNVTLDNREYKPLFMGGKELKVVDSETPTDLKFNYSSKSFFADAPTFHYMVNGVFDYRITKATRQALDLFGFIKKYWIVIAVMVIIGIMWQSGELPRILGI